MTAWFLPTRSDTSRFGEALGRRLGPGHIVALIGDLGSGKTTLAKAIANGIGVRSHVSSPTFGLIHEYAAPVPVFHFDPYRLERSEELADLGFHEFFDRGGVVLVEWADKFPDLLPTEHLMLRIDLDAEAMMDAMQEDAPRRLLAAATGEIYATLLADVQKDSTLQDLLAPMTETAYAVSRQYSGPD